MKILVTGVAGFIGFHLSKELLKEGHEVVGIDNINDYYEQSLKISRLNELGVQLNSTDDLSEYPLVSLLNDKFSFIWMDITNREELGNLFGVHEFELVVNLAAQAGVRYSIENPSAYVNTNIVGFHNILELSHKHNIKHVIYASSSSVYGFNEKFPFSETDRVDYPVSMYAATKKSSELMAHTYSHLHNLPTTGLRFFTVYGPWGRPDMAPFLFTKAIAEGRTINVFNNGDLYRDFTYIDDIVDGLKAIVLSKPPLKKESEAPFCIFNIGNNEPVNLMQFISITEKHVGVKAKKKYLPMQPGDVYKTYADIDALKNKVGYSPKVNLDEGMQLFVAWYKDYYNLNTI